MCQVGEYTFEITIDVVNMVERKTTQSENVKELRFSKNIGWSQFAYLKLCKTRSGFSIPLDFEIAKVACITEALPGALGIQGEGLFIFRDLGRRVIYFQGFGEKA